MSYLSIDTIKDGHILAEDVHDINGRLLLSKGQQIEPKHMRIFRIWGITEVNVSTNEQVLGADTHDIDPEKMAGIEDVMRLLLKNTNLDHPLMKRVFQNIVEYRYEQNLTSDIQSPQKSKDARKVEIQFDDIQRKINSGRITLPEAPTVVIKLNDLMDDPHASSNDVAQIVSASPSLSATLLRIVNSAAFGLSTKVDSIVRAVSLLGTRQISSLAIGISVMKAFGTVSGNFIDMSAFIIHSLSCATIARIVAALANIKNTEQVFISGLLHDIGKLILFKYFPEQVKALMQIQADEYPGRSLFEIEKKSIGTTHAQIAGLLLKQWKFPDGLRDNVVCHHTPSRAQAPAEASIVQIADIIAHGLGLGSSVERIIAGFDEKAWHQVGISESAIAIAIRQSTHQLNTIKSILF